MLSRYGLRVRMAASYVLVSAAAVLVVEVVLLTLVAPAIRSASDTANRANDRAVQAERSAARTKAKYAAAEEAAAFSRAATVSAAERPGITDPALLAGLADKAFPVSRLVTNIRAGAAGGVVVALTGLDRRVVATSSEDGVRRGSVLPVAGDGSQDWQSNPVRVDGLRGEPARPIGLVHVAVTDRGVVDADLGPTDPNPPIRTRPIRTRPP